MAPSRVLLLYLSTFHVVTTLIGAADPPSVRVPDYMLRLYEENLSGGTSQHPEIIRSFTAQLLDGFFPHSNSSVTHHYLSFQTATLLPADETLKRAQLRLRTLIRRHYRRNHGATYLLRVYLLKDGSGGGGGGADSRNWELLLERKVTAVKRMAWEALDVSRAVSWWQRHRGAQVLLVTVERVAGESAVDIDFSLSRAEENEPLLLVYSTDNRAEDNGNRLKNDRSELKRKHKREIDIEELEEESNSIWDGAITARPSAAARRKKGRSNPCRRRPLYVDFATIRYDSWIIAPRGYEAYECVGRCHLPMSDHLTPTKHAIIQSLVHAVHPERTARPCCVPTRLEPISLLYVDDNGVVTYKYNYQDMVVAECGCR